MENENDEYEMELNMIRRVPEAEGVEALFLHTTSGIIEARLHDIPQPDAAVVWVGGAGGGMTGPAGGMYVRLAERLAGQGVGSLRVDYRRPNDLVACALDTLMGAAYLGSIGYRRLILVGHSFGGAVVITAAVHDDNIIGVATLASQNHGTELTASLGERALLLLHGEDDTVLPTVCSEDIFSRAVKNKELILYPDCGHNFDDCGEKVEKDLMGWMERCFRGM